MPKDACYRKVMKSYGKWSARAAQATAKCRKSKGQVRKTKAGSNLKRWTAEKWVDTRTGKPCGTGNKSEYCRPSKRVSSRHLSQNLRCLRVHLEKNKQKRKELVNKVRAERKFLRYEKEKVNGG